MPLAAHRTAAADIDAGAHFPQFEEASLAKRTAHTPMGDLTGTRHSPVIDQGIRNDRRDLLKRLRAFCHAARQGSITDAATVVCASQPSVSLLVRALEKDLGIVLFERSGPRIELTAAGRMLYGRALPLVEGLDRVPDTFAEQFEKRAGPLHLAAGETTSAYLLPRYVARLHERHGDSGLKLKVGDGSQCLAWLRSYEVDLVIRAVDLVPSDLEFRVLVKSPYELITPAGHPLAALARAGPRDLQGHALVAHTRASYIRVLGDMFLNRHGVTPNVVVEVDGWEVIKDCVEVGIGVAVVPILCLTDRDRVGRVPFDAGLPPRRYGCLTRRESILPLAVRRFMQVLDVAPNKMD